MIASKLPSVLQQPNPDNTLSMERALKQIRDILESVTGDDCSIAFNDRVQASIDDVETMLASIDRS